MVTIILFFHPANRRLITICYLIVFSGTTRILWQGSELFLDVFCIFWRLQPIDIDCMKQLHSRVNIVPVIGKADTLTQRELHELKKKVIGHKLNLRYTTLCYSSNGDPCELAGKKKRKPRHPRKPRHGPKQMFRRTSLSVQVQKKT